MKHLKTFRRRSAALLLSAALALSSAALAADPSAEDLAEARQQDLDVLYETLQARHPDLFANTPESAFLAYKAQVEDRLSQQSDVEFLLDLQGLTALAKDSHTSVALAGDIIQQMRAYPMALSRRNGRWYATALPEAHQDLLGKEVTAIAGKSPEQIAACFRTVLSADNPVKLLRQYRQVCNAADYYEYLNLVQPGAPLVLTLENGKSIALEPIPYSALGTAPIVQLGASLPAPATAPQNRAYWASALSSDTYYIQYNRCAQDPELPMNIFAAQIRTELDSGSFRRIVLDLRNNGGGSDGVLWPLLELFRQEMERGTEIVGLIGETTFSSAIINAVELQEMGAVLAGDETSGSVDHFGSVSSFSLPNSGIRVGVSTKWIDMGTLLDADAGRGVETLAPDVPVRQTMEDTLAGRDTAIEWLLAHPERLEPTAHPDAPLTRGRFLGLLHQAAGSPSPSADAPFSDLLGIEWYLDAVFWAAGAGVTRGDASGCFAAARPLTWQEAAVFLVRAANALHLTPQVRRTSPLPQALRQDPWDLKALETAWSWGLLPEDAVFSQPPTRAQGVVMIDALCSAV